MAQVNRRYYLKNEEVAMKAYADSAFTAARSYTDTAKNTAISTANNYTDTAIANMGDNYLAKNNTAYYEPTGAYNPATKKYVDDQKTQYNTMPTPSNLYENKIVQYMGDTNQDYTQGYFYICVSDGGDPATYTWEQIDVQDGGETEIPVIAIALSQLISQDPFKVNLTAEQLDILNNPNIGIIKVDLSAFGITPVYGYKNQDGATDLLITAKGIGWTMRDGKLFIETTGDTVGRLQKGTTVMEIITVPPVSLDAPTADNHLTNKAYVDNAIAAAKTEIVSTLPQTGEAGKVYIVKEGDIYHQYIYNTTDGWVELSGLTEFVQVPVTLTALRPEMTSEQIIEYLGGQDNVDKLLEAFENGTPIFGTNIDPTTGAYVQMPMTVTVQDGDNSKQIHFGAVVEGALWDMDLTYDETNGWSVDDVVITPMASQAYVTGAVNAAIAGLDITTRAVVAELPTQDISTKTIYMVPNSTPGAQNIYDEYIWLGDRWEMIGDTHIDLSTKQDVIQYSTMPAASSSNVGQVVQYIGNTSGDVEQGHFYICVSDGGDPATYSWVELTTQDSDLVFLSGTMFAITTDDTSASIIAKLGGQDKVDAILDAIQNQDKLITGVSSFGGQYANAPVFITSVIDGGVRTIIFESTMQGLLSRPCIMRIVLTEENGVFACTEASTFNLVSTDDVALINTTMPSAGGTPYNQIIQYVGPTTNEYIQGHYYHSVYNETTHQDEWQEIGDFVSHPELAEIVNNLNLNNMRYNFPAYYVDLISFSTEEPYITPSLDDVQAAVIAKMQEAYDAGKTKFYLVFRNANGDHPIRSFPVLVDINTNTGVITTTGYKQVGSVTSTGAVSYAVSLAYGTWSISNNVISHTGEHIGAYLVTNSTFNYLAKNNITAYTPTLDFHPATKKYVDDTVSNGITGGVGVPAVEIMPTANANNFGKVVIYSGCEENVYWMPGHMYQCQQWEDEQHNVSYHWVEMAKRDAYDSFMPEATEENYGLIIQYKGQDTNDYKKGHFYRCAAYTDQGTVLYRWEPIAVDNYLKKDNTMSYTPTTDYNPTTKKYVDDLIKPVVIWESNDPSTYLTAISANISASPAWQLTNLDMTPFKRIKIYTCAGQSTGTTTSASTTAAMVLEMSLDPRAAISAYGGNYVGSIMSQKPNDSNRLATLTCAVSADKTSFVVLRQTNLYGTAATANNDVNANVFLIEGYYY